MTYRRPGVTVTQEFVGLVPALAAFALPCAAVGPAYQLVEDDLLGTFSGAQQVYPYASLMGGAIVDLEEIADDELFPKTKKPLKVMLKDVKVEVVAEVSTGAVDENSFTDPTTDIFAGVQSGDLIAIAAEEGVEIVAANTAGVTYAANPNRISSSSLFGLVKPGDTVSVTGGTNANIGDYSVVAKVSDDMIIVDGDVNAGTDASDLEYSITGDRGDGKEYRVKSKTDDNTLVLETELSAEAPLTYSVVREWDSVELDRVSTFPGNGYKADESGITLPSSLEVVDGSTTWPIASSMVYGEYRALRNDLASEVREYSLLSDVQSVFGVDQITPANPLAYALSVMMQNTVTAVNGLALSEDAADDETLAYTKAGDVIGMTEMYAIAVLTQNPVIHTTFKNHVEQLSLPEKKRERVVLINSKLVDTMVLKDSETTSTELNGSQTIVNTQIDGSADFAADPALLTSPNVDTFLKVQKGDTVTIQDGDNVTAAEYLVDEKIDNENIKLGSSFITSGTAANIQFYVQRQDGIEADGMTFYDRDAAFVADGIAAGHYLNILSGDYKGRYKIGSILADRKLELAEAIPGIAEVVPEVEYQIDRDMQKTEQAGVVAGYSEAIGSRRVVHCWPDIVKAPIGQEVEDLPGFYLCCTVAALTTGLPTQQGFTNTAVSGFLGFDHSTKYFNDEQLNTIASGGTMIFEQDGPSQPLYIRHQLTTDRSAIKFQEFSVTKNVDFIAKFIRTAYLGYPGVYNIIDTTEDDLRTTAKGIITFLKEDTRLPRIGGVIRSGKLKSVVESEEQIDTMKMRFGFNIPIPLNNIDITIEV